MHVDACATQTGGRSSHDAQNAPISQGCRQILTRSHRKRGGIAISGWLADKGFRLLAENFLHNRCSRR